MPSNKRSNGVFPAYPPRAYYKDSRETGVTDPTVVQRLLRSHVHSQMHTNPPDPNDRSYFPMVDDVRYGNTIALMDATYKTTRYELPLFLLVYEQIRGIAS